MSAGHSFTLLSAGVLFALATPFVAARELTDEALVIEAARQYNANAESLIAKSNDPMNESTFARADGKNLIFYWILRAKKDISSEKLAEFQKETFDEIAPRVCQENAKNEAFHRGMFYTFVYRSRYGQEMAAIVVARDTCSRL
ncbi:MAG: hypothetical protein JZU52_19480 [Lamprocystis purpurea]|jgi:transposase InsO family protein|uniref:hypothetical protein n=1 Tax=Lamprocystis purpurea TaxID=61598 RepID=UPI0012F76B24|nr:hypothetical protein [Lamprocystis purpurea]MBV5275720.1 hypothetical protein [Lamprocystis purpurea]